MLFYYQAFAPNSINEDPEMLTSWQRLSCLFGGEDDIPARIRAGLEHGFYSHAYTVYSDDPEDGFMAAELTGMSRPTPMIYWKADKRRSGMVGDIAITDEGQGWVCLAEGWQELPDTVVRVFQASVTTVITPPQKG